MNTLFFSLTSQNNYKTEILLLTEHDSCFNNEKFVVILRFVLFAFHLENRICLIFK